jgi:hypothetical protein
MRNAHRVKDAQPVGGGGSNIDPTIEIEEAKVRLVTRNPREHPQRDGAIAADHEWDLLGADDLLDPVGQLACDGLNLGERLRVVGGTVNATATAGKSPWSTNEMPSALRRAISPAARSAAGVCS